MWKRARKYGGVLFQSPCGGRGRSDIQKAKLEALGVVFQSPYGGRGRSDSSVLVTD